MDDRHHLPVPVGHDHSLYQTGYVNKEYLISRSNEGSDNSKPMLFPDPCKAEWQKTSDNRLRMHVQVKNNTGEKTITSFTLIILAVDVNGNPVNNGDGLYEETINKRIEPGKRRSAAIFTYPALIISAQYIFRSSLSVSQMEQKWNTRMKSGHLQAGRSIIRLNSA